MSLVFYPFVVVIAGFVVELLVLFAPAVVVVLVVSTLEFVFLLAAVVVAASFVVVDFLLLKFLAQRLELNPRLQRQYFQLIVYSFPYSHLFVHYLPGN